MGRKTKIGKRRRDRFYHLAKETGYRARSAFKLIQLNRKFQFLQQSRVVVDLCAAPGSWLQVAVNHMPVSSLIIGVDLVPIKPIHRVVCLQADITTTTCKQLIQRELQTWKVDCVLHDGAPNVGSAWIQDAFSQARLTLSALKLSCELLKKGGWFVTKVFRSKDYPALLNVFQQLFQKVHATKPQASRIESAEIFVVCRGFLAPSKLDARLVDPKFVFNEEEQENEQQPKTTLKQIQNPPKSALGYPEGKDILFQSISVADFIMENDHMQLLASCNQLVFDTPSEVFRRHSLTTEEIKEFCKDVKVLGLRELRQLVQWRKKMRQFLDEVGNTSDEEEKSKGGENSGLHENAMEEDNDPELAKVDKRVEKLVNEEIAEAKRILRRQQKQKKKLQQRMQGKSEVDKETAELLGDQQVKLFSLQQIKAENQLVRMDKGEMVEDTDKCDKQGKRGKFVYISRESDEEDLQYEEDYEEQGEEVEEEEVEEEEEEEEEEMLVEAIQPANPLVVSFENENMQKNRRTKVWFSNPVFEGLEEEEDEDEEIGPKYHANSGKMLSEETETKLYGETDTKQVQKEGKEDDSEDDDTDSGSSIDDKDADRSEVNDQFETVPLNFRTPQIRKLDPEGLALGALMVQSKKKKEDLIDSSYHRWTHDDENLPDWFVEDELEHYQKQLPVTREMMQDYQRKLKEINARPIKKIAEAKSRKKRRALKKLITARRKAEIVCETGDVTDQEKARQLKNIYKKAGLMGAKKKPQEVKYVVAKKGLGKRVRRPAGVSGRFKVVDPRMKKDKRAMNKSKQTKGKNKSRR